MHSEEKRKILPPGQTPIKRLLRWGKDHPTIDGFVPKLDLKNWILTIDGEVENPLKLNWNQFLKLPKSESVSDFHCVEGWTVLGLKWEGILFKTIIEIVKIKKSAKFVSFECADKYTTSLSLEEVQGDDILFHNQHDSRK